MRVLHLLDLNDPDLEIKLHGTEYDKVIIDERVGWKLGTRASSVYSRVRPNSKESPSDSAQQLKASIALLKDGIINDNHNDLRSCLAILEALATAAI